MMGLIQAPLKAMGVFLLSLVGFGSNGNFSIDFSEVWIRSRCRPFLSWGGLQTSVRREATTGCDDQMERDVCGSIR